MRLAGHDANRVHGTLQVDLADGRQATLEINIDVSDPRSFLEIQNHYDDEERGYPFTLRPARLLSQTLSVHWPAPLHPLRGEEPPPPLTIRVPVDG